MESKDKGHAKAGIRQQTKIISLGLNVYSGKKNEGSYQIETQCHPSETINKILLNIESTLTQSQKKEYNLLNRRVLYKGVEIYKLLHISDLELDSHQPIKLDLYCNV